MGLYQHDERDCDCVNYRPDFTVCDLRLTGDNYYCSRCQRYVSSKKWQGGLIHLGFRTRFVKNHYCPCCGYRMRIKGRAKHRTVRSIIDQTNHPENYTRFVISKLKYKQKLLKNNKLIPTVT